ncbi:hypothetical protein PVE_R1G2210 [Pseudomonas veronii 1YdBTEX2]|uniref:Uncharacterized protein n=1 Tax=Pseudomonas veronii 1YdBTEX2 TaxID=1295141 RepID=A0A1D3JVG1_PSEVE|nr:hypothetical protein [Pseudomonas veronii]SBW80096.1 hypothetical protein PVE_R1G2210 [Pseudomonas veronii 1YdBTEX2]
MAVNEDVEALLVHVSESLKALCGAYQDALSDEEKLSISKPVIKGALENLRSVLDYAAQDVSAYIGYKKGIYFPYATDEPLFRESVKKNLRGLRDKFPKGYNCIEEIQSFRSGDNWLKCLCDQVNINKHNKLSSQIRINSPAHRTILGQVANLGVNCTIVFKECDFDGVKVGWDEPISISWNTPVAEINRLLGATKIKSLRAYEWVEFRFEGTSDDALNFIRKCHVEVSKFVLKLYSLM